MTKPTDLRPRFITYLACGLILVILAPQTSDIATIRVRELSGVSGFEYPALARVMYVAEKTIAPSRIGIALLNALVGTASAVVIAGLVRQRGGRSSLWMGCPTLMLVALNVEGITALLIVLAVTSWRRGRSAASGMWVGLGAAFKLAPVFMLPPLAAGSGWRGGARVVLAAAATWLAVNLPYAWLDPVGFRLPYLFAMQRQDGRGTIWSAAGLSGNTAAHASLAAMGAACLAIALAARRGSITTESGCAFALLALLGTSKLWQPHYLLWALAALTFTGVPVLPVRCLEVANLAYFIVLWRQLPAESEAAWLWPVAVARLASLIWVARAVCRHARVTTGEQGAGGNNSSGTTSSGSPQSGGGDASSRGFSAT
jgi:uncharacterized membrane protein